jgi:hypothetical protein
MVLFLTSVAQAGSSHHHEKADVVSPFDKTGKPVHCILNNHQHLQNIDCPHQKLDGKSKQQEFRPDCKTQPGSANSSSSSYAKELSKKLAYSSVTPNLFSWKIDLLADKEQNNLPRLIDHPPQFS